MSPERFNVSPLSSRSLRLEHDGLSEPQSFLPGAGRIFCAALTRIIGDSSVEAEAAIYWLSWVRFGQLIAVFLVAIGVVAEFAGEYLSRSLERPIEAAREERLARLAAEAESSRAAIAEANARTAEAQLSLERLRKQMEPRRIQQDGFLKSLEGKPRAPIEIMFPKEDGEAFQLSMQLRDLLRVAQWEVKDPAPIPPTEIPRLSQQPSHMAAGAQPTGIAIVVRAATQEDFKLVADKQANTPLNALQHALFQAFGTISTSANDLAAPPIGILRIIVGPKP